jgi:ribosomal protein L30E
MAKANKSESPAINPRALPQSMGMPDSLSGTDWKIRARVELPKILRCVELRDIGSAILNSKIPENRESRIKAYAILAECVSAIVKAQNELGAIVNSTPEFSESVAEILAAREKTLSNSGGKRGRKPNVQNDD